MAILFLSGWLGVTIPIVFLIVFTLFKPIIIADSSGISIVILALLVAILDGYIGIKLYEKRVKPWWDKRKNKII